MSGGGASEQDTRAVLYCVVPGELAARLHEPLRRHFQDDPGVEVVVEQRGRERRKCDDRRGSGSTPPSVERRLIRAVEGRRVAERRALLVSTEPPVLPRRYRRFFDQLLFAERLEPAPQEAEDVDTARLVSRIQAGDSDAFSVLYLRYFDRAYGYLRLVLRDAHEAEDAAQEVFVRLWERIDQYERKAQPFRAWLFVVLRNHALNRLRATTKMDVVDSEEVARRQSESDPAGSELPVLDWISDRDLMLFVERLPLAQRQVLVLRYMLELTHAQTAAVLSRNPDDVRALHSRALRFLNNRLSAIGRAPRHGGRVRSLTPVREARILRARRFALLP